MQRNRLQKEIYGNNLIKSFSIFQQKPFFNPLEGDFDVTSERV